MEKIPINRADPAKFALSRLFLRGNCCDLARIQSKSGGFRADTFEHADLFNEINMHKFQSIDESLLFIICLFLFRLPFGYFYDE
jgi:hypothetical protein